MLMTLWLKPEFRQAQVFAGSGLFCGADARSKSRAASTKPRAKCFRRGRPPPWSSGRNGHSESRLNLHRLRAAGLRPQVLHVSVGAEPYAVVPMSALVAVAESGTRAVDFEDEARGWKIACLRADYVAVQAHCRELGPPMKLDKIYTRTGDEGKTSLGDGARLPKFHLRVAAYGSIDEANSVIGVVSLHVAHPGVLQILRHIQNDLFDVGADLCRPERAETQKTALRISEEQVTWLESQIDRFNEDLEPLTSFVLPGGSPASAYLHLARTATRRAERDVVRLSAEESVNPAVLRYINRLSDLLFVLARFLNDKGKEDVLWKPGLHR